MQIITFYDIFRKNNKTNVLVFFLWGNWATCELCRVRRWPFCADKRAQKPPKGEKAELCEFAGFALRKPTSTRGLLRIVQEVRLSRSYAAVIRGLEPKLCRRKADFSNKVTVLG